jgi:starch phosphorylase
MRFGRLIADSRDGRHFFQVQVFPGGIRLDQIKVELYANSTGGNGFIITPMKASRHSADSQGAILYTADVPAERPAEDFTPRVVPYHPNASIPLEEPRILWQH